MRYFSLAALGLAVAVSGCATTGGQSTAQLQKELEQTQTAKAQLKSKNAELRQQLADARESASEPAPASTSTNAGMMSDAISLVPPNAQPGQCFARVVTPAKYKAVQERVLASAASTKIRTVPAEYKWVSKRILVKPASTKLVAVPATYKTVTKKIMVSPEHTKWVPGHGSNERVNPLTGQTMCLITVPAEYKTVTKRVVDTPATTKEIKIPAEYKSVRVRKLVHDASTKTVKIPAEYQTVTHTKKVRDSDVVWSRVVCHRNATSDLIAAVQKALKEEGYDAGPVDGILGWRTMRGVRAYDKDHDLAYSSAAVITYATLDSLGIDKP